MHSSSLLKGLLSEATRPELHNQLIWNALESTEGCATMQVRMIDVSLQ